jgi:hypothetical protein
MHSLARRWLLALLLVAATGAQTLGLLHQVVHQPAAGQQAHDELHEQHGPLDGLFALDDAGVGCHLLDQLAHGAGPASAALGLSMVLVATQLPWLVQLAPARRCVPFEARGPPVLVR